jgi:hypothetical protein
MLASVDLSEVVTHEAFDLLTHTEKNQLLALLPEVDRTSAAQVCEMFASENFHNCVNLYHRMLESGVLDTNSTFSHPATKKRRNQMPDPWKVAQALYCI